MSHPPSIRWPGILLLAAGVAAVLVTAYLLMFSVYMLYDDEGYVLYSLNNFSRYGALYDRVYTQYGPFFFLLWGDAARLLGFEWTHDLGRLVSIANWVGTASLSAWVCLRLTRSAPAAALTLGLTFVHLWQMTSEPQHPGGTVAILIAAAAAGTVETLRRNRLDLAAALLGAIGAALLLTKINVGVFFLSGACLWLWLLRESRLCPGRIWDLGAVLGASLMPVALMWRYLGESWAGHYALVAGAGILTTGAAIARSEWRRFGPRALILAAGAALAVCVVTLGLTLAQGTTPAGLLDGVLLGPLRHAGAYHFGFNWRPGATSLVGLSGGLLLAWLLVRDARWRARIALLIAILRLVLLAGFVANCFHPQPATLAYAMMLAATTAWLCVVPLTGGTSGEVWPIRAWLGLLLAWQYLHAYPVAGSQIGWGTFLWVPLLVSAAYEGGELLGANLRPERQRAFRLASRSVVLAALLAVLGYHGRLGWYYLKVSESLGLPGAELLRLPPEAGSTLRFMSRNATAHGDVLFSLPGTYSFNLWTGLPTPNQTNATHWFTLLSQAQQWIVAALAQAKNPVVIVQPRLVFNHLRPGFGSTGALEKYLCDEFEPAVGLGPLSIWLRRGRKIAVLDGAELYTSADPAQAEPIMVSIVTDLSPDHPVDRIEVAKFVGDLADSRSAAVWRVSNTRADIMPIDLAGRQTGPVAASASWPLRGSGLVRINFYPRVPLPSNDLDHLWIRLIGGDGVVRREARFTKPGEGLPTAPKP